MVSFYNKATCQGKKVNQNRVWLGQKVVKFIRRYQIALWMLQK